MLLAGCASTGSAGSASGITFVHLNDTYRVGAVEDGTSGGFGRVVTIVRDIQSEGRTVRILHGGDFLYPSLESQIWDGEQMVDAFNYMDAVADMYVVAGNHEFDRRSPDALINAVRQSEFDWIGDNYRFDTGAEDVDEALNTGFIADVDGRRIGFLSLTLHESRGGNRRDYVPIEADYLAAARRTLKKLEAAGVDAIVGLTHLHIDQDRMLATLKAEHPKLAFVVGGHEHEPEYAEGSARAAPVYKGASNARKIWRIDLGFDANGAPVVDATMIDVDESIEPEAGYVETVERRWRARLLERYPFLEAQVGTAAVPLDAREVTIRNEESNWGNFVVDQMRVAFGREAADLAFINSGTLRIDDYIADDITFEDIARTFGFSSYLHYFNMTGEEFRATLEAGYRGSGPSKGYFPQVSGFRVCVDRSREEGERIVSLQVPDDDGWEEIDGDAAYSVVAPEYIYGGGDGYEFPQDGRASKRGSELKYLVLDAILRAQADLEPVGKAVDPANPRIVILTRPGEACWRGEDD